MRIGVYSGEIPTSKFIEQMLQDFANKGHEVYVYGTQKGEIDYYKKLSIKPRIFSKNKLAIILSANLLIISGTNSNDS